MGLMDRVRGKRAGGSEAETTPVPVLLMLAETYWRNAASDDDDLFASCARQSASTAALLSQEIARVERSGAEGTSDQLLQVLGDLLTRVEERGGVPAAIHAASGVCLGDALTTILLAEDEE